MKLRHKKMARSAYRIARRPRLDWWDWRLDRVYWWWRKFESVR